MVGVLKQKINKTIEATSVAYGFTIVELLVVIVIIGILAAITIVSYNGITGRAAAVSLQSDLANASQQLKIYLATNGTYPNSIDCSATPAANTICLKSSNGNTYNSLRVNNINQQTFCLDASNGGNKYYITDNASSTGGSCYNSCLEIMNAGDSKGDGEYLINPDGAPLHVYCDMTTDGGGWTLALQNNSTVTTPSPTWDAAINGNNISGTLGSDPAAFDVLVGLAYWNNIGTQLKLQVGTSPSAISHKATYTFSLNSGNYYAISLSNQNILLGVTTPGITSSSGRSFTTYDADHDTYPGNCATLYNNHPWWYSSCWSGNFFAGGSGYQEAAYWSGSSTDYYAHGSIWIK